MKFALSLGVLGLLCGAALASVVLRADIEALARKSDRAVEGVVRESTVVLEAAQGRIWTRHRLDVTKTLVGTPSEQLVVHVPGGRVGDIEQSVHGSARLEEGARVALFLWEDDGQRLRVLGQAQGCFRVEADAASGEAVATNDVAGLTLVDPAMRPVRARRTRLRLADLRRRVSAARRALVEEERRRKEAVERRLEELRKRAEQNEERTRGRPGGAR